MGETVDITRAFTFAFDDDEWIGKLVMIVIWTFVSAIPVTRSFSPPVVHGPTTSGSAGIAATLPARRFYPCTPIAATEPCRVSGESRSAGRR